MSSSVTWQLNSHSFPGEKRLSFSAGPKEPRCDRGTDLCASSGVLLNGSSWCRPYCSHQSHICGFSSFWNPATRTSSGDVCCRYWRATWSCKGERTREATWKTLWEAATITTTAAAAAAYWVWNDAVPDNKSSVSAAALPPRMWF